ncbi:MAG: PAS domain-containing protein, partial [Syntrophomonadaceae bacterium]|nr:PAS domain-containing protein [Syntrophomonadaceae bacterium]
MTDKPNLEKPIENVFRLLQSSDEALLQYGQKYRYMAENSFDIISLHKPDDLSYLYVNPTVQICLGYLPDELLGKSAHDFIHPEDQPGILVALQKGLETGGGNSGPYRFKNNSGDYVWLESTWRVINDEGGTEA